MTNQISNTLLMVIAAFMSTEQGVSMMNPKQSLTDMFAAYGVTKPQLKILGSVTLLSGILTLSPVTFLAGMVLTAAETLFVIFLRFRHKDLKGFAIELPFIMLNILMIYLQYPVKDFKHR